METAGIAAVAALGMAVTGTTGSRLTASDATAPDTAVAPSCGPAPAAPDADDAATDGSGIWSAGTSAEPPDRAAEGAGVGAATVPAAGDWPAGFANAGALPATGRVPPGTNSPAEAARGEVEGAVPAPETDAAGDGTAAAVTVVVAVATVGAPTTATGGGAAATAPGIAAAATTCREPLSARAGTGADAPLLVASGTDGVAVRLEPSTAPTAAAARAAPEPTSAEDEEARPPACGTVAAAIMAAPNAEAEATSSEWSGAVASILSLECRVESLPSDP
jgi:hypothetical protein